MNDQLTPGATQLLWMLATHGDEGAFEDALWHLKKGNEKAHRDLLIKRGYIAAGKKQRKLPGKRATNPIFLTITPAGWNFCNTMVEWMLPAKGRTKADLFLKWLMPRLKKVFDESSAPANFSDFLNKSDPGTGTAPPDPASDGHGEPLDPAPVPIAVEDAIRSACLALGGGRRAVRVRIAELRKQLSAYPDAEVTAALWAMSGRKELTMFRLDDPRQLTAEDHQAAVKSTLGQELHIVYYGGTPS